MPFKILSVYLLITLRGTQVQKVEMILNKTKRDQQVKKGHWKECKELQPPHKVNLHKLHYRNALHKNNLHKGHYPGNFPDIMLK